MEVIGGEERLLSVNQILSLSKRFPLLIVRLRALLIEVFKYVREPMFMNMLFTLGNKPDDIHSGSVISQTQVKTIKLGINSFVYQGSKQWNALPADAKDIEGLNVFKNYVDKWMGHDCYCEYCVLCDIKTLLNDIRSMEMNAGQMKHILTHAYIYIYM